MLILFFFNLVTPSLNTRYFRRFNQRDRMIESGVDEIKLTDTIESELFQMYYRLSIGQKKKSSIIITTHVNAQNKTSAFDPSNTRI